MASGPARLSEVSNRHVARGGRVGPGRTCDGFGGGSAVGGGGAETWDAASASAHVGRATASEAGWLSDVAAPRVGPRLLLHVRQKSMWRIDRGARET